MAHAQRSAVSGAPTSAAALPVAGERQRRGDRFDLHGAGILLAAHLQPDLPRLFPCVRLGSCGPRTRRMPPSSRYRLGWPMASPRPPFRPSPRNRSRRRRRPSRRRPRERGRRATDRRRGKKTATVSTRQGPPAGARGRCPNQSAEKGRSQRPSHARAALQLGSPWRMTGGRENCR
jgi:hypothetical protein